MITITNESGAHAVPIETLLDRAFGADRQRKRSYAFRRGVPACAPLCLVALQGDNVVGTVRQWPVTVGRDRRPVLLLGPLAVDPDHRRAGIGTRLMLESLVRAAALGYQAVLLVGDPGFYERFGFTPAAARGIRMAGENPLRLMCRALCAGGLDGLTGAVQPWRALRGGAVRKAA